ncbi:MAG: hypothetical protein RLZZ522_357 [Verrucomicrobiota bacterium]
MSEVPNEFAGDPDAAKVLHLMAAGFWRKARDAAKELCKKDRGRYLVLLIRANVGLVREMLGKGLVKEAETVVSYLATFAPADTMALLRAEMAAPTGKRQVKALADSGGAGWWLAALRADGISATGGSVSRADQAAVDLLVTDGFEPDEAETNGQALRLAAELNAVRSACAATGEGRWEEAKQALRDLPRQSVFSQWRIFLRGVRCAFEEERETARQCFAQLPPAGALARAAASLAPDLAGSACPASATATVPLWLAVTGQPAAWSAPILTAANSWKAGKRVQAFDDLVAGMKEAFPSVVPGLPALLTDAVLPSHARMNDADWEDSETLYQRFGSERTKANSRSPQAVLAVLRSMCVAEKSEMPHQELDRCWRLLIELWRKCHGPDRQRDSLAWRWLGDALATPVEGDKPFDNDLAEERKNAAKAIKAYETSIDADESNDAAWLGLVSLLIRQGETKRSNKMLDELVKKFPHNKGILMLAGDNANARKSFAKGANILRAALALDPLDRALKTRIVVALTLRVREASRKGTPTAPLWAEIEPLLENNPPGGHYMLSRWMARVRRSLLDTEPEAAAQAESDAIALAPSALIRLFFATALASVYRIPPRQEWEFAWIVARSSPECTWKSLLEIIRVLHFTSAISGWGWKHTKLATDRVLKLTEYLVAPGRLKEDPAGLLGSIYELFTVSKSASEAARHVINVVMRDMADAIARQVSPGAKKTDPRLRLASVLLGDFESGKVLNYLKSIIADAEAAGLPAVAAQAREVQQRVENPGFRQPFGFSGEEDEGDEDPWDDDENDIWDDDDDEDSSSEESSIQEVMEDLQTAVSAKDPVMTAHVRKSLRGMGLTEQMIDKAIEIIANTPASALAGKTAEAKKPTKNPGTDSRQSELF